MKDVLEGEMKLILVLISLSAFAYSQESNIRENIPRGRSRGSSDISKDQDDECIYSRQKGRCLTQAEIALLSERYEKRLDRSQECPQCCPQGDIFDKESNQCISKYGDDYYLHFTKNRLFVVLEDKDHLKNRFKVWESYGLLPSEEQLKNSKQYELSDIPGECPHPYYYYNLSTNGEIQSTLSESQINRAVWLLQNASLKPQYLDISPSNMHLSQCGKDSIQIFTAEKIPDAFNFCPSCDGADFSDLFMKLAKLTADITQESKSLWAKKAEKQWQESNPSIAVAEEETAWKTKHKSHHYCLDKSLAKFIMNSGEIEAQYKLPPPGCAALGSLEFRRDNDGRPSTSDGVGREHEPDGNSNQK